MDHSKKKILFKLIELTRSSEEKYKKGDFKGAADDRREVRLIYNSIPLSEKEIINFYKKELSNILCSKFDLINDHKKKINSQKKDNIINLLEEKSRIKYKSGDYKGSVRALRRLEKYQSDN